MNTKRCDEFLDDRDTYNRLDKTAIGSDSAGSPKGKAYWDGKLGGGSAYEGLRKKKETDLTSFFLAYSKSLRTLSPVKTPVYGWKCEKKRACVGTNFTYREGV